MTDPRLVALVARGRAGNPGVSLDDATFLAHLRERGADREDTNIEDLFLACAAANGDPTAVARVEKEKLKKAERALSRIRDDGVVDETMQRLREALFVGAGGRRPRIAEYAGRGDLAGFIRTVANRMAMDLLALPKRETSIDGEGDFQLPDADPQLELMKRQYGASFKQALADAVSALPREVRADLRAYYLDGKGLEEMAATQKVAASTISRRLAKARSDLLAATRGAMLVRLRVDDSELDSILRLIETRLDLTRSALGE